MSELEQNLLHLGSFKDIKILGKDSIKFLSSQTIERFNFIIETFERENFTPPYFTLKDEIRIFCIIVLNEGGLFICFIKGNSYADIEFTNTDEILGVCTNRDDVFSTWNIELDNTSIEESCLKIIKFLTP